METKGLILAHSGPEQSGSPMDRQRPRHLLPVRNEPILFHALGSMAAADIRDVAIAVSSETEDVIGEAVGSGAAWGLRISHLRTASSACLPSVLLAGESFLDGRPFVLQHGDGLLRDDLGALLPALEDDEGSEAILLVHPAMRARNEDPTCARGAALPAVASGLRPRSGLAVAGVQIFGEGFIARARDHLRRDHADADVAALAGRLARCSTRVTVRRIGGWRRFDGDPAALLDMNRVLLDELDPCASDADANGSDLAGSRIEGRVRIDPSARVESSVIRGPVVIGANATIEDAFVGPYTAIGEHVRIEGTEIENSILFPGAALLHVGARLEGCVIGRDARVARHFSISRAMRLHLSDSTSVLLS